MMMKRHFRKLAIRYFTLPFLTAFVLLAVSPMNAKDAVKTRLEDLSWLAGQWHTRSGTSHFEEHWMSPSGGMMIGMGRETEGKKLSFHEYLRIEQRPDGIYYVAQPFGKSATDFKLTKASESAYTFENPQHDFPKRIEYAKQADGSLVVKGSGDASSKEKPFQFILFKK